MRNKYVLFLINICLSLNVNAQSLKTYKGIFGLGNATYQYYEDEAYNRYYHGPFIYKCNYRIVSGFYNENKRDGHWSFTQIDPTTWLFNIKCPETKTIVYGNYSKGKMEGEWFFILTQTETNKILMKSMANFKNGKLSGEYTYIDNRPQALYERNISVTGYFHDGFFNGKWLIRYTKDNNLFEDIRKYKDGYLYFRVYRNSSNGEILERIDSTNTFKDFSLIDLDTANLKVNVGDTLYDFHYNDEEQLLNFEKYLTFWLCFDNDPRCETNPLFDKNIPGYEIPKQNQEIIIDNESNENDDDEDSGN